MRNCDQHCIQSNPVHADVYLHTTAVLECRVCENKSSPRAYKNRTQIEHVLVSDYFMLSHVNLKITYSERLKTLED